MCIGIVIIGRLCDWLNDMIIPDITNMLDKMIGDCYDI